VIPGLAASIAALIAATAFGFYWRSRNGRIRTAGGQALFAAGAAQSASGVAGSGGALAEPADDAGLTADELGSPLGTRATLVQFSSAFCAPCRATRRILTDVAAVTDGVSHVDIDAESNLDLVRRLDIRRTPTTFVLNPDGHITHRASGQPRKADVIAALGAVV
jgi:thiol-disulfide isomerase/thioredoxin